MSIKYKVDSTSLVDAKGMLTPCEVWSPNGGGWAGRGVPGWQAHILTSQGIESRLSSRSWELGSAWLYNSPPSASTEAPAVALSKGLTVTDTLSFLWAEHLVPAISLPALERKLSREFCFSVSSAKGCKQSSPIRGCALACAHEAWLSESPWLPQLLHMEFFRQPSVPGKLCQSYQSAHPSQPTLLCFLRWLPVCIDLAGPKRKCRASSSGFRRPTPHSCTCWNSQLLDSGVGEQMKWVLIPALTITGEHFSSS